MSDRVSFLCKRVLPAKSVRLGRLLSSRDEPLQGYYESLNKSPPSITTVLHDFSSTNSSGNQAGLGIFLTNLFNVSGFLKRNVNIQLEAAKLTSIEIDNTDKWFKQILAQDETRDWIQECIENYGPFGSRIYLVVGVQLVENAKITVAEQAIRSGSTQVTFPLTAALGDATALISPILGNPGVSTSLESSKGGSQSFRIEDIVFALRLRRVKLKWFSSKNISSSYYLDPNTSWKAITDERAGPKGTTQYDTLEAVLSEGTDDEETEQEELDGEEEEREEVLSYTDDKGTKFRLMSTKTTQQ